MKTIAAVCLLLTASASAFSTPNFATRAVSAGPVKKASGTKVVAKAAPVVKKAAAAAPKKVVAAVKKATPPPKAVVKAVVKAAAPKPVISLPKTPPASSGYPSFRDKTENFKPWANISGGGNKSPVPAFVHPTLKGDKVPFTWEQYKELAKTRLTKGQAFAIDDGLSELERSMRKNSPAFLNGGARSYQVADKSAVRDLSGEPYALGLNSDRFQLLFISIFAIFTLVGSLSGALDL